MSSEECPYRYASSLRRLDEEIHMLDFAARYSPLWLEAERRSRFMAYASDLSSRAGAAKRLWTVEHGCASWMDYLTTLYDYAQRAFGCTSEYSIVVVDTDSDPVVYFARRAAYGEPTKSSP